MRRASQHEELIYAVLIVVVVFAASVAGVGAATPPQTIVAKGHAEVQASPDTAILSFAIDSGGATAQEASDANAKKDRQVEEGLKASRAGDGSFRSSNYSLIPQFSYNSTALPKTPSGYAAWKRLAVNVPSTAVAAKLGDQAPPWVRLTGVNDEDPQHLVAQFDISATGATASKAVEQVDHKVQETISVFSRTVDPRQIKLDSSNVIPSQSTPTASASPQISGYTAHRDVILETTALDNVGGLVDTGIRAGATRLNSVEFKLNTVGKAQDQAVAQATHNAQVTAASEAAVLGVKLGKLVNSTVSVESQPLPAATVGISAALAGASTGTNLGPPTSVPVAVDVELTYAVD